MHFSQKYKKKWFRLVLSFLFVIFPSIVFSQELKVVGFHEDIGRLDAVQNLVYDFNGKPCGLIRLGLVLPNVEFEGDIVKKEFRNGEWFIWMIEGAGFIVIKSPEYLPLHYDFNEPIKSNITYIMTVNKPEKVVYVQVPMEVKKKRFDFEKDFKFCVGLNNGIISSEIFGFYGEIGFGKHFGLGVVGGLCPGFTEKYSERWSVGLKCYLKNISLSACYGTLLNIYGTTEESFLIEDDGTFYHSGGFASAYGKYGISALIGYDHCYGWLHVTTGVGLSIPQSFPTNVLFVWNIGIGVSVVDLFKKK